MAIDRTGISSLNAGASDITYTGNEGPRSPQQQMQQQMQQQQMQQQQMAILVQEYKDYVMSQEEAGRPAMPFEEWVRSIQSPMAQGGRAGFQRGGGPDWINTHEPEPMGNPAVVEDIEDAREFRIANPNIEDVADYEGYYERQKRLEQLKRLFEGMKPTSGAMEPLSGKWDSGPQPGSLEYWQMMTQRPTRAYGGTAHPTYTQSRRQRINAAGGGIMGSNAGSMLVAPTADGSRPGYGWLSDIKDKFVDDIIPNEIKDNPMLTAAIVGGGINQFGLPDALTQSLGMGSDVGQNWLGDLISKVPGTPEGINTVIGGGGGGGSGYTAPTGAMGDVWNMPTGMTKVAGPMDYLQPGYELAQRAKDLPFLGDVGGSMDHMSGAKSTAQKIIDSLKGGAGSVVDFLKPKDPVTDPSGKTTYPINWASPLAIGTAMGAAQAAMPQAQLPHDTSGIDIADIRSRALTGSDPGLHFLPPASATTAYAQGGRIGYQGGGNDDLNNYSIFFFGKTLDELTEEERIQLKNLVRNKTQEEGIMTAAQGGRIGYADGTNEEKDLIMDPDKPVLGWGLAEWLRQKVLGRGTKTKEAWEKMNKAQGGRIGAQEGGLMNLGGMEKDYRQEGGFVPLGGEEKADDVPARLSKNEFVFTADAVRSAGGGDIDAGAEVMENLMNNLEQGGQVSEDSQGLEGARDMFGTAQRLEGVM